MLNSWVNHKAGKHDSSRIKVTQFWELECAAFLLLKSEEGFVFPIDSKYNQEFINERWATNELHLHVLWFIPTMCVCALPSGSVRVQSLRKKTKKPANADLLSSLHEVEHPPPIKILKWYHNLGCNLLELFFHYEKKTYVQKTCLMWTP